MCSRFLRRSLLLSWLLALFLPAPILADRPQRKVTVRDETALAARIDQLIEARLAERKVPPAALIDDAVFIRRVFLDLAGRIPNILEVRDFLDDDRANKRRLWVDQLLHGIRRTDQTDTYSDHFAALWRSWLLAQLDAEQGPYLAYNFEGWLRKQLRDNVPYDKLVRQILTANPAGGEGTASAFFPGNGNSPESLAAATSRLFLGMKLECAQCHDDRSGGNWTRDQFWQLAAFFTDLRPDGGPGAGEPRIAIPNVNRTVSALFPGGGKPAFEKGVSPRVTLANWLTNPENPHFARATVNRVWAHLFGTGLVEPVEERGPHNPASHPELLDELAAAFVNHNFDLKYLLRSLVLSRAYQRSSRETHPGQGDPRLFARGAVRGLSAEQLFDSLAEATEYRGPRLEMPQQVFGGGESQRPPRQEFAERFGGQEKRTETQTTILQALYLMNGRFMAQATSLEHNKTLATIADAARIDTTRRLETLFLVALSRKPTEVERNRLVAYIDKGGPSKNPRKALADVFWALLNSSEFILNH